MKNFKQGIVEKNMAGLRCEVQAEPDGGYRVLVLDARDLPMARWYADRCGRLGVVVRVHYCD